MSPHKSNIALTGGGVLLGILLSWGLQLGVHSQRRAEHTPPESERISSHAPAAALAPAVSHTVGALPQTKRGHYVLDSDVLWVRDRLVDQVLNAVDYLMASRDPEYSALFSEWGIDDETSKQLRHHIAQIYRAKVEICQAKTGLVNAQVAFDQRMRELLGSNYSRFAEYEANSAANRELARLRKFAEEEGFPPLTADEASHLRRLLRTNAAYSNDTLNEYGGLFDKVPDSWGGQLALPLLQGRLRDLLDGAAAVGADAPENAMSAQTLQLIEAYFTRQAAVYQSAIDELKDPLAADIRRLERDIAALRSRSDTDPRILSAAVKRLEVLYSQRRTRAQPNGT